MSPHSARFHHSDFKGHRSSGTEDVVPLASNEQAVMLRALGTLHVAMTTFVVVHARLEVLGLHNVIIYVLCQVG